MQINDDYDEPKYLTKTVQIPWDVTCSDRLYKGVLSELWVADHICLLSKHRYRVFYSDTSTK